MFVADDRLIDLHESSMTNCCVHYCVREFINSCWQDGSISKQWEDGEVDDRLATRARKDGVIFSTFKKNVMESIFKMAQSKTHKTILTAGMELESDGI